jgi:hypothetical protein
MGNVENPAVFSSSFFAAPFRRSSQRQGAAMELLIFSVNDLRLKLVAFI